MLLRTLLHRAESASDYLANSPLIFAAGDHFSRLESRLESQMHLEDCCWLGRRPGVVLLAHRSSGALFAAVEQVHAILLPETPQLWTPSISGCKYPSSYVSVPLLRATSISAKHRTASMAKLRVNSLRSKEIKTTYDILIDVSSCDIFLCRSCSRQLRSWSRQVGHCSLEDGTLLQNQHAGPAETRIRDSSPARFSQPSSCSTRRRCHVNQVAVYSTPRANLKAQHRSWDLPICPVR